MKKNYKYLLIILIITVVLLNNGCDQEVYSGEPIVEEDLSGTLFVDSNPKGASIYLDGRITGLVTPDTLMYLSMGEHSLVIKKEFYFDTSLVVNVQNSSLESVFIDLNTNSINFGKIICESQPSGGNIFLNDSLTDKTTPDSIENLTPGIYEIKISYPNHRTDSTTVLLAAQQRKVASVILNDTTTWVDYNMNTTNLTTNNFTDVIIYNNQLWCASQEKGLFQFNGTDWINYPIDEFGLGNISIRRLKKDNNGNLWLCVDGALIRFNSAFREIIRHEYIGADFNDLEFDSQGNLWCGSRYGLSKFDGTNWTLYSGEGTEFDLTYVSEIAIDENDVIYIGTNRHDILDVGIVTGHLFKFEEEEITLLQTGTYFYWLDIVGLDFDSNGRLWYGLREGYIYSGRYSITYLEGDEKIRIFWPQPYYNTLMYKVLNSFQIDENDTFWGCYETGLMKYDSEGNAVYFNYQNSRLGYSTLAASVNQGDNIVWIATESNGIYKYKIQ